MKQYDHAEVKFNGGIGGLFCNGCSVILKYGFNHKDCEHYCEDCEKKQTEKEQCIIANRFARTPTSRCSRSR
jgi:hypothetical protein